ncbi:HutD family protein [Polaromonas jejuensis]|uniref:HutD family protein n=1 Tax=Polaromonas jejuensis TaxID=457502 RepID=A0ABW0Q8R7_9BURK|nr:HutD family protein [Polaromonas jejuensis]
MQFFDLAACPPMPWKNGGGSTRELACWPAGAGMQDFGWRVSVATIATPGPFSIFAEVDRVIMLLDGDGVHLRAADGSLDHALDQRWQPLAFSGDAAVDCRLLGGTSTDFNLMLRRGQWRGHVQVANDARPLGKTPAGLCMVLGGRWTLTTPDGTRELSPGQGLWWAEEEVHGALAPIDGPQASAMDAAALAWLPLSPA